MLMQCELRKQKQFSVDAENFKLKHELHILVSKYHYNEHDKVYIVLCTQQFQFIASLWLSHKQSNRYMSI